MVDGGIGAFQRLEKPLLARSNDWKNWGLFFQSLEEFSARFPIVGKPGQG